MHFLHTNLQYLRSQVVFYKERDIPYRKRGLTFCFPFQRLQGLYLKEIVLMVQKRHLICIQFHKNMVPFANRFQHHLKSRSVYQCVFFAIMPFFEEKVENNLEYGMFFKKVHHLLEKGVVLKHHSKISRCCFYVYSGPSIKWIFYSLTNVWNMVLFFKQQTHWRRCILFWRQWNFIPKCFLFNCSTFCETIQISCGAYSMILGRTLCDNWLRLHHIE